MRGYVDEASQETSNQSLRVLAEGRAQLPVLRKPDYFLVAA